MRKGFDSLCGIITAQMNHNALSGAVFIFFNKKHNQVKLLLFEGDGFALYHKRLERGTYELPVCVDDKQAGISIPHEQLQLILQGDIAPECTKEKKISTSISKQWITRL
jgi:transposase